MQIKLECILGGKIFKLDVDKNETILDMRKKLEKKEGFPVSTNTYTFCCKTLENNKTFEDYGIKDGYKIEFFVHQ